MAIRRTKFKEPEIYDDGQHEPKKPVTPNGQSIYTQRDSSPAYTLGLGNAATTGAPSIYGEGPAIPKHDIKGSSGGSTQSGSTQSGSTREDTTRSLYDAASDMVSGGRSGSGEPATTPPAATTGAEEIATDPVRAAAADALASGLPGFTYEDAPAYISRYGAKLDELLSNYFGRDPFAYDPSTDPLYQYYADMYTRNGQDAMRNTLAQVSARTGGLASSYAGSAAQGAYNDYMRALNDKVPELEAQAYSRWQNEGNRAREDISLLNSLEAQDYARYLDQLGQYNSNRNFDYGIWSDALDNDYRERNFAYNQQQDALDNDYRERSFAYGQQQDAIDNDYRERNFAYQQQQDALDRAYKNSQTALSDAEARAALGDYSALAERYGMSEEAVRAAYEAAQGSTGARGMGDLLSGLSDSISQRITDAVADGNDAMIERLYEELQTSYGYTADEAYRVLMDFGYIPLDELTKMGIPVLSESDFWEAARNGPDEVLGAKTYEEYLRRVRSGGR